MKIRVFAVGFFIFFSSSFYAVQFPSEPYVSPYSNSDKTSIWGSTLDDGAGGGMQTSSLQKADESYCPYCYAIDPTMGEEYNECLQYNKEDCNALYGEACSIHGEASLPISDEIFPLMFFALFYLIYRYKKRPKEIYVSS